MKKLFRAIRDLVGARKGFRWSLYFVHRDQGLRYALHENAVIALLGHVLGKLENGKHIAQNWELHINFNWEHKSIKLEERYFQQNDISRDLLQKIASIDPGWMVPGGKPVFVDARTRRRLPLGWAYEAAFESSEMSLKSIERMLKSPEREDGPTLGSVIREVFQERGT